MKDVERLSKKQGFLSYWKQNSSSIDNLNNFDILNQYISESYAIDTKYGIYLRVFGYIPGGVMITLFCFLGLNYFQPNTLLKIGFYGIGIFYGIGTIFTGIFPCDSGCNRELIDPSFSQISHNFSALLMYLLIPFFYDFNWDRAKKINLYEFFYSMLFIRVN